jgi:YVTN family beta-propeller protein
MSERLSGTVTFLFTDIEGSTSLLKQLGRESYGELLQSQSELLRAAFVANRGEEIDNQGDSFFVAFRSASDAVAAAVAIQRALADHEWPDGVRVLVRIGMHSGEAAAAGERYVGFSVHRAARIGGAAHGGQVLLSSSTRELVEDDLPDGVFLRDLGLWRLKDVDRPERITQVAAEGLPVEFPPLRGAHRVKSRPVPRRSLLAAALVGVIAAAVAVPVFALGSGSSGSKPTASAGADSVEAVDSATGRFVASVPLGTSPGAVAAGLGSVWAVNTDADSVSRIDPKTKTVQQTISVGSAPEGIAIGDGFVWVANFLDNTVSQIDPRKNGGTQVGVFPVGHGPTGLAFGDHALWVTNTEDRTIMRIDPFSGGSPRTIPVDAGADAIAVGDGAVWVASESAGSVTRIDPGTFSEQTINVGNGPDAVAVGPGDVWVVNSLDNTVSQIDPSTNTATALRVGSGPSAASVSSDGKTVWVANELGGSLTRIDSESGSRTTVDTGNQPSGLTLSQGTVYVAVRSSSRAHSGGTLTELESGPVLGGRADNLDPNRGIWEILTLTNDGLVAYRRSGGSQGGQLVPDLAVSLPTPTDDGKTYTFQLRRGIHYSNGALVQPDDFRRAIERLLTTPNGYEPGYYVDIVGATACLSKERSCDLSRGIVADPQADTVTFHLRAPDPEFLYKLGLPPADAVPPNTPVRAAVPLPATGPYLVASYVGKNGDPRATVRLVRNPRFRAWSPAAQPNGYPDSIIIKYGLPVKKNIEAVERGAADLTFLNGGQLSPSLQARYGSQLRITPLVQTAYLTLNTRVAPFNDVRVRRAVNFALDRNRLVALAGGPVFHQLSCQVLPPSLAGYSRYCPYTIDPSPDGAYHGPDLAKAKRLVAASGTKGETVVMWVGKGFLTPREPYLISVLRSLGYKASLKVVNPPVWLANVSNTKSHVQVAGFLGWVADYPAASDFFLPLLSCAYFKPGTGYGQGNINSAEFCDHHIDTLINHARTLDTTNPQGAAAIWSKIDQQIVNQAPLVGIYNTRSVDFVSQRVGNYQDHPVYGALLDQLWVR